MVNLGEVGMIHDYITGNAFPHRVRALLPVASVYSVPSTILVATSKIWPETKDIQFLCNLPIQEMSAAHVFQVRTT